MSEIELMRLIEDYENEVSYHLDLMRRQFSGQYRFRFRGVIPEKGVLKAQETGKKLATFRFHGIGCQFGRPGVVVDMDFGPNGETNGFDFYRILEYARSFPERYGVFQDETTLRTAFERALKEGSISPLPNSGLCIRVQGVNRESNMDRKP